MSPAPAEVKPLRLGRVDTESLQHFQGEVLAEEQVALPVRGGAIAAGELDQHMTVPGINNELGMFAAD